MEPTTKENLRCLLDGLQAFEDTVTNVDEVARSGFFDTAIGERAAHLIEVAIKAVSHLIGDVDEFVQYYAYELDFGRSDHGNVVFKDGTKIHIQDFDSLIKAIEYSPSNQESEPEPEPEQKPSHEQSVSKLWAAIDEFLKSTRPEV